MSNTWCLTWQVSPITPLRSGDLSKRLTMTRMDSWVLMSLSFALKSTFHTSWTASHWFTTLEDSAQTTTKIWSTTDLSRVLCWRASKRLESSHHSQRSTSQVWCRSQTLHWIWGWKGPPITVHLTHSWTQRRTRHRSHWELSTISWRVTVAGTLSNWRHSQIWRSTSQTLSSVRLERTSTTMREWTALWHQRAERAWLTHQPRSSSEIKSMVLLTSLIDQDLDRSISLDKAISRNQCWNKDQTSRHSTKIASVSTTLTNWSQPALLQSTKWTLREPSNSTQIWKRRLATSGKIFTDLLSRVMCFKREQFLSPNSTRSVFLSIFTWREKSWRDWLKSVMRAGP